MDVLESLAPLLAALLAPVLADPGGAALVALVVLDVVFVFAIVFVERDDPTRTLQWLMALLLLPFLGALLYLAFHQDHRRKRERFEAKARADLGLAMTREPPPRPGRAEIAATDRALGDLGDLARLVARSNPGVPVVTGGNEVRPITDGKEKFATLLEDLRAARRDIHVQYFIVRDDAISQAVLDVLAERARAGVEVRLLVDAMGGRQLRRSAAKLRAAGAQVARFYPGLWRINYRNHRKIVAIDGQVGYCGGYNIGDEYLGLGPLGPWRDAAVRVEGPAVDLLQLRFLRDWLFASGEDLDEPWRYFGRAPARGSALVQEVSSGPDTPRPWIQETFLKMILEARESCYLQTPYFAPGEGLLAALRIAASSGVDVRIMIPDRPDHPFVFWATRSFCGDLLASGVRCYQYRAGFLHAKTLVIDDRVASIGTANFDRRSFVLNFETNLLLYDPAIAAAMREEFLAELAQCSELTPRGYAARPLGVRAKESVSRLFYPLA